MGCGIASGENRAIEAAQKAISSPLLEGVNIKGAKSVLLNVTGSSNLTMQEINEGNNVIFEAAGEEANVIFGCVRKEEMNDYVSYTVIATGFETTGAVKGKSQPKQHKEDTFKGGFNFFTSKQEIDSEDLDVPTILRVKSPQSKIETGNQEEDIPSGGFKFTDRIIKDKGKNELEPSAKDEEDESSSFLRMIMD
jgi:cell division protein FtsZ